MFGYVSIAQLSADIRANIHRIPADVDLVVGIPRSGMIPAYMIGLFVNTMVTDLETFLANGRLGHGRTRKVGVNLVEPHAARHVLLVDDSVRSGASMQACLARVQAAGFTGKLTTCAAIVVPDQHLAVDLFFRDMPQPRIFEWNALHHSEVRHSCFALDGLLCADPPMSENARGYEDWLHTAQPLFKPNGVIGHIVSERSSKFLDITGDWLTAHDISCSHLHLRGESSSAGMFTHAAHVKHKARIYRESGAALFYESNPRRAQEIASDAGRAVMCIGDMQLYLPTTLALKSGLRNARWHLRKPLGRTKVWFRRVLSVGGRN